MATPPGGPYGDEYGNEYQAQPPGSGRQGRFNFPSAPSGSRPRPAHEGPPTPPPAQGRPSGQEWTPPSQARPPRHPQRPRPPAPAEPPSQPRRRIPDSEPPQPLVRPYAMTGGRTRPRYQLAIEALVSTTADPSRLTGQLPEHQRICQLCYEVKSVAEVSALLTIPLGVARILVADLAEAGLVAIHQPGHDGEPGGQPDVTLLERVLSGLRKL
ncbi:DUF742 domain-containing protein [Streptomyces sp. 6N223]|uniref:DUF742 domain-containing protein n=1 Tax=Streptomyces sp. 6N223 TaxID=3457412 RepID=UPI003FD0D7C6